MVIVISSLTAMVALAVFVWAVQSGIDVVEPRNGASPDASDGPRSA